MRYDLGLLDFLGDSFYLYVSEIGTLAFIAFCHSLSGIALFVAFLNRVYAPELRVPGTWNLVSSVLGFK